MLPRPSLAHAMSPANTILVAGAAGILALDMLASSAARWLRFPYKYSMVGSLAIYIAVGWYTALADPSASPAVAAMLVGLAESTLGWAISWKMGPGRPATLRHIKSQIFVALVGGAAAAAAVGWAAGWAARRWGS
jgi:hypothetical protein